MRNLSNSSCVLVRAVWIASLVVPLGAASAQSPADLKAYSEYTLTLDKYQQYLEAALNLAHVAVMDPQLANRLDVMGNQPLAAQVQQLDQVPEARRAIANTGLTTKDFVLAQGAALQAGRAHTLVKRGKLSPAKAIKRPGVSRANLEFFQKNEARIGRLVQDYEARKPRN